ncbi:hypothetical protein C8F04DRAFT_1198035 [Mycena alexandri]|uniref:Uncharacterized protein n=1 Tax=Mycena alexandri TaxID=1745969 RepID=A0AAD6S2A0_9AGAR|nr:hypothetical protein C8F04DRAFT_1198035 [Mycena alexandri]
MSLSSLDLSTLDISTLTISDSPSPILCAFAPGPKTLLCAPVYVADAGREDITNLHNHTGKLYAIITGDWKGVATLRVHGFTYSLPSCLLKIRRETFLRLKAKYPHARTWDAEGWPKFDRLWTIDCTEYHFHPGDPREDLSEIPGWNTLPSSPTISAATASSAVSPAPQSLSKSKQLPRSVRHDESFPTWFARTGGTFTDNPPPLEPTTLPSSKRSRTWKIPPFHAATHKPSGQAHLRQGLLYAVTGHTRIFQERDSAMEVLKRTPGGELFFSSDEGEVWAFLEGTVPSL